MDRIIRETINEYLNKKGMLKEYKNPNDSETVRVCTDQLESLYERIITDGGSKNEFTIMRLGEVISELRKIQKWMT